MTVGKNTLASHQMIGFVERIEAVQKSIKALRDDEKVIVAEATRAGFLAGGLRAVIKARALKPSQFRESEDLRDLYFHAAGLATDPPLFKYLESLARDVIGRDEVIQRMKELVPASASIVVEMGGGKPVRITRGKDGEATVEEVTPPEPSLPPDDAAPAKSKRAPADVPDVDDDGAEDLGREAAKADRSIIDNPFPFGDKRRARWDLGWRKETGTDGMGPGDGDGDDAGA